MLNETELRAIIDRHAGGHPECVLAAENGMLVGTCGSAALCLESTLNVYRADLPAAVANDIDRIIAGLKAAIAATETKAAA